MLYFGIVSVTTKTGVRVQLCFLFSLALGEERGIRPVGTMTTARCDDDDDGGCSRCGADGGGGCCDDGSGGCGYDGSSSAGRECSSLGMIDRRTRSCCSGTSANARVRLQSQ